jgi:Ca2+-binding RTX toxin-like protein
LTALSDGFHTFEVQATDPAGNTDSSPASRSFTVDATPPGTTISSGPSGATNDPTATFAFSSPEGGSSFQCKLDADAFAACASPRITAHLTDGSHTFSVRAKDPAGNLDPTPSTRAFTVATAEVSVSGSTLVVTAAAGAKDNLAITRPSGAVLRVTDSPSGAYRGSGVHTGAGCTRSGDYTANCGAAGITLIQVVSDDQIDRVVNATAVRSSLDGGAANDVLTGGSVKDILIGRAGADVMKGRNGNDELRARDLTSDTTINCDGGSTPGAADKAALDLLPKDPDSAVTNCETETRH